MCSPSTSSVRFACATVAVLAGLAASVPAPQQQQRDVSGDGVYGKLLWSVFNDCLGGGDASDSVAVCLKSKALVALDRALSKPTLVVADGVTLSARAGKSLHDVAVDPAAAEKLDRAALDAVGPDAERKNALLDDMLVGRIDRLMATRTIVLDGPAGQEGRGKKKEKAMQQAMMMAGMMAAAVMGPMALKMIVLMAGKALLLSKIALVLSGMVALKKLFQPQQSQETESVSHHYGRSIQLDAHDMAYSSQKQQ